MPQPRPFCVKICGLSTIAHLRVAEACGAAHVGFIVEVARSPRSLSRWQARVLAQAARVPSVMVTTGEDACEIAELAGIVQPAAVQLHAGPPALLSRLREALPDVEFWKVVAVEVGDHPDLGPVASRIEAAVAAGAAKIVLDSAEGGRSGGTGLAMSWDAAAHLVEAAEATPVILAGGLHPGNVAEAIRRVRPAGVDVSSGVETAPNAKSPALIRAFCEAVRQVTSA
jgi:phosphoribosylanthranilate isomerase